MLDEFKNAFQRYNNAHVQLIWLNVIVFLFLGLLFVVARFSEGAIFTGVYKQFTLPATLSEFVLRPWTLITYAFAHYFHYDPPSIGIMHILFNMLFLYWFGRLFVEYLGSDKLIALYVLGALAGGIAFLLMYNTIPAFVGLPATLVGASAAVYAIMTATAVLLPDHSFYLLLFGPVKIKYIAAFSIVLSLLMLGVENVGGNMAHLGGAFIGFVYMKQLQAGSNWGGWITVTIDWVKSLFKEKRKVKVSYRNNPYEEYRKASARNSNSTVSQAEIDAILDKISEGGYDSLTKDEKEKLFNASKK